MRTDWKAVGMNIAAYALLSGALLVTFFFTSPVKTASASDTSYPDLRSASTPTSLAVIDVEDLVETPGMQAPILAGEPVSTEVHITEPQKSVVEVPQNAININTASELVIDTLPGIGPVKAKAIVAWRIENGPYKRLEDLMEVKGIGEKTFNRLEPLICH